MINVAKWLGTAVTIAGALATAAKFDPLNVALLNLGSVIWLYAAYRMREASLVVVNAALLMIYMAGAAYRIIGG